MTGLAEPAGGGCAAHAVVSDAGNWVVVWSMPGHYWKQRKFFRSVSWKAL